MKKAKTAFAYIFWASTLIVFSSLQSCKPTPEEPLFRNLGDDVHYTGSESCRPCHAEIYATFMRSEMGRSISPAERAHSSAFFNDRILIYDSLTQFYYHPFWRDSQLFVREFRLSANKDTTHLLEMPIHYIIGSGQHTNSHLTQRNNYLFQAPITFYTQDSLWDLAPGFAHGGNERFFRALETECLSCHSDQPNGVHNYYPESFKPIGCERCHGPGSLHIAEKQQGILVDTSQKADLSIVRPSRLPRSRLLDLCERCHLQAVSVLREGKSYLSFRPGMKLNEHLLLFLPRYENSDRAFIMASHPDRLRKSRCFQESEMSCLTCHNPHRSVREMPRSYFISACLQCHNNPKQTKCKLTEKQHLDSGKDCINCHMPKSTSIDIPHVRITDHYIRRDSIWRKPQKGEKFIGLELLNANSTPLYMAQGYLAFHEKYDQGDQMLDSAFHYLQQCSPKPFKEWIYYYFARKDYGRLLAFAHQELGFPLPSERKGPLHDAFTCYRIGEALLQEGKLKQALQFFELALQEHPYPPFLEKRGLALAGLGRTVEAKQAFLEALSRDPLRPVSLNNLGYLAALDGLYKQAESYYLEALKIQPDYTRAQLNLKKLRELLQ